MINRIFVVEDNDLMRETLCLILELERGLTVCGVAATAEDALAELSDLDAELVVVDVCLPARSGIELVEDLSRRRPDLRCLMHSASAARRHVKGALAAGARGYVIKGRPGELASAVRKVLDGEIYLSDPLEQVERPC